MRNDLYMEDGLTGYLISNNVVKLFPWLDGPDLQAARPGKLATCKYLL